MTPKRFDAVRWIYKPIAFILASLPFLLLIYNYQTDNLSANPLGDITNATGTWTLRFVCITLAITPLRKVTNVAALARFRRMAGLFAFFYGSLHLMTYLYFDKFFEWGDIAADLTKRRFIIAGFTAWSLMLPLALTSTDGMTRRLGGKAWKRLHRLVYVTGIAAVVHYTWLVKADLQRPLIYMAIVSALLGYRVWVWWKGRKPRPAPAATQAPAVADP